MKLNCICKIRDEDFNEALKGMLFYSGHFQIKEMDDDENTDWYSDPGSIVFVDKYEAKKQPKSLVVELTEHEDCNPYETQSSKKYNGKVLSLYRYMCFSELLATVVSSFDIQESRIGRQFHEAPNVKSICVVSAAGGIGSTTISQGIATALYRNGFKVLGIDISPVRILPRTLNHKAYEPITGLTGLIYNLLRERSIHLSQYTKEVEGGEWIIRPTVNLGMDKFDLKFIEKLKKLSYEEGFDFMIFDIGSHLDKRSMEIIAGSNMTVFLFPFNEEWIEEGMDGLDVLMKVGLNKSLAVINDSKGQVGKRSLETLEDDRISLIIPFCNDMSERRMEGDFGHCIRFLADKITGGLYG